MSGREVTAAMAARTPVVTSREVGCFVLARTALSRSMTTASVWVPPTSMPSRRSSVCGMGALHRNEVDVVAEGAGTGDLDPCRGAPDRRGGEGQHHDALAVADAL